METITVHNCHKFTDEQIIDFCAARLAEQGCKSEDKTQCLYRGPNNTKCAFGLFIPDEDYNKTMEGKVASDVIIQSFPEAEEKQNLFRILQRIHDSNKPKDWPGLFAALKEEKGNFGWEDKYYTILSRGMVQALSEYKGRAPLKSPQK